MVRVKEIVYRDLLKVEFKDMMEKFMSDRPSFHMYMIDRACTHGTMVGFDYGYCTLPDNPSVVCKYLDLNEFGRLEFHIDYSKGYGKLITQERKQIISNFLANYSVDSETITTNQTKR